MGDCYLDVVVVGKGAMIVVSYDLWGWGGGHGVGDAPK